MILVEPPTLERVCHHHKVALSALAKVLVVVVLSEKGNPSKRKFYCFDLRSTINAMLII